MTVHKIEEPRDWLQNTPEQKTDLIFDRFKVAVGFVFGIMLGLIIGLFH